ncbi:hypothetical protein V8F06_011892 [Rhypophila decipiens]
MNSLVLFIVLQGAHYKLAQIPVAELSSHIFFSTLREKYFQLRGFLRSWLSVWRYAYCDFYKACPRPIDSIPPISKHEFQRRFYACRHTRRRLHFYHSCKPLGHQSRGLLERLPKKTAELEEGGDKREEFWGIYAREIISLRWVLFYNFVCMAPMLGYFVFCIVNLQNGTDLQNPSVPFSMMMAMLSLFWSIFLSSLQFGKSY